MSAQETLRFQINSDFANGVARTDATGAGAATLFGGSSDSAHDLLFRAYVLPSADLTAPVLHARPGPGSALLGWTASPAATSYDVLDANGVVRLHTVDTHATVAVGIAGETFTVRANGPSGFAVSAAVAAHATGLVPVAANLCDSIQGVGKDLVGRGTEFIQTFTAANAGLLTSIELDLTTVDPLTVQILDDQGTVLAETSMAAPFNSFVYAFPPLSRVVPSPVAADLSASGVHVVPGQALQLLLRSTSTLTLRDSTDAYPGGDEIGATPPRDLCFQVYVDPSR